jgi:hypothetical protein
MTVELTPYEAEILIAVLTGAEMEFAITNPALAEALAVLKPWRSSLIGAYIRARCESPLVVPAVEPAVESGQG